MAADIFHLIGPEEVSPVGLGALFTLLFGDIMAIFMGPGMDRDKVYALPFQADPGPSCAVCDQGVGGIAGNPRDGVYGETGGYVGHISFLQ